LNLYSDISCLQGQIEEAVMRAREEKVSKLCEECEMVPEDFDKKIQPIIDSCTKEAMLVKTFSQSIPLNFLSPSLPHPYP